MKVDATVILFLSSLLIFLWSPPHGESFTLYNFLLDHLDCTLVSHSSLYSSTCPIQYLLWLSVSCSGWNYTVQGSSPHKCGQKSCCNALNAVVTTFPLDISAFLSPSYTLWSSFLTLEVLRNSVKVLEYLFIIEILISRYSIRQEPSFFINSLQIYWACIPIILDLGSK